MKKLVGVFATIALLGSGAAIANDDKNKPQQDPSSAQGGSGAAGSSDVQSDPATGGSGDVQSDPATGGSGTTQTDPATGGSGATQSPPATGSSGATQSDPALGGSGATQTDPALGGSGSATAGQSATGQKELTGKVVKAGKKMVWVDMQGAVVPLTVDKSTQFSDPNLKRAADLQVGQEIRASYEVKSTDNIAKSISMSGTGGSGSGDMMSPDSSINQGTGGTGLEEDKGLDTGGSGMEQTPPSSDPATGGAGGSGDTGTMNPDTGSSTTPDTH
jgi:hypothetical protein